MISKLLIRLIVDLQLDLVLEARSKCKGMALSVSWSNHNSLGYFFGG